MTRFAPLALALSLVLLSACSGKDKAPESGEGDGVAVSRALWGQNLTDETYKQVGIDAPIQTGSWNAFLGSPRLYGVTLRVRY